MQLLNIY